MLSEKLSPDTVYVLGAGFSREANIPLQSQILESIRDLSLSDAPPSLVNPFLEAWNIASVFLMDVFGAEGNPSLEDVFTLLDQTVTHRQYCMGYSWRDMDRISKSLNEAILYLFHIKERNISEKSRPFYNSVGAYLTQKLVAAGYQEHPFSIISLNWDCVLDNAIYWCLRECNTDLVNIDYCCYSNPVPEAMQHTPSLTQNARGIYKIKIMKLHGSTNWLLCPNCGRLYTGLGLQEDMWTKYILGTPCPRCKFVQSTLEGRLEPPVLESFLITPTFVKKFENSHIRMVWHNAYIDLCEAKRVVFIGYSLPEADYHVRTLLRRAIRPDAKITVVLAEIDKPRKSNEGQIQGKGVVSRYREFFRTSAEITFAYSGVKGYFRDLLGAQTLPKRVKSLKNLLEKIQKK